MIFKVNMMKNYVQSCQTEFWQKVFQAELNYLLDALEGARDILSIGCGPAIIEKKLSEHGFGVTGLDISYEVLKYAPDSLRSVVARAEAMPFLDASFDAVIFIASLQFIENNKKAIDETARVLRSKGKLVAMLLNPESFFFKEKQQNPDSYVQKIKHRNLHQMEVVIAKHFALKVEYFLGIKEGNLFETRDPKEAALYVINGQKLSS